MANREELACTYASLILHDDGIEITSEKLSAILAAAKVDVQPVWTRLFSRVLASKDLNDLILNAGSGAAAAAPAAAGAAAAEEAPKEEEKPAEEEEESDDDMGFGLFD